MCKSIIAGETYITSTILQHHQSVLKYLDDNFFIKIFSNVIQFLLMLWDFDLILGKNPSILCHQQNDIKFNVKKFGFEPNLLNTKNLTIKRIHKLYAALFLKGNYAIVKSLRYSQFGSDHAFNLNLIFLYSLIKLDRDLTIVLLEYISVFCTI